MTTKLIKNLLFPIDASGSTINPKALTSVKVSFGHKLIEYDLPEIEDKTVIDTIYNVLLSYYQRHE